MSRPCVIEPQIGRMGFSVLGKERRRYVTTGNGAVRLFGLALATVSAAAVRFLDPPLTLAAAHVRV